MLFRSHSIRRVQAGRGETITIAGFSGVSGSSPYEQNGPNSVVKFNNPTDITFDSSRMYLFVSDTGNHCIKRVEPDEGGVTRVIAGSDSGVSGYFNSDGASSRFNSPRGILIETSNRYLIICDTENQRIRRYDINTDTVTTIAGDGTVGHLDSSTATSAKFNYPIGIVSSSIGYAITEISGNYIRRYETNTHVSTMAGNGTAGYVDNATGTSARFNAPIGIAHDGSKIGRAHV